MLRDRRDLANTMMLFLDHKTPEQHERWDAAMAELRLVEEEARESDDPWFFHGTSAIRAAWIRREGFRPSHLLIQPEEGNVRPDDPRCADGVNWGTVNVAQWAAERYGTEDDPPVILAARLSSLRKAGALVPDHFAWSTGCTNRGSGRPYDGCEPPPGPLPVDPDWRESLDNAGAFGVVGCERVDGMVLHEPLRHVAVHPDWEKYRAQRRVRVAESYGINYRMPPRGMAEANPRSNPPTLTSKEAFDASWERRWPTKAEAGEPAEEASVTPAI